MMPGFLFAKRVVSDVWLRTAVSGAVLCAVRGCVLCGAVQRWQSRPDATQRLLFSRCRGGSNGVGENEVCEFHARTNAPLSL